MKLRPILPAAVVAVAAALAAATAAQAHVTLAPRTAAAGSYAVLDVRVPNERDDAGTVNVDLKLPDGFVTASFQPVPGWNVRVIRQRLARPIETADGPISEQISRIVWSGGRIPPGAFQDFPISVKLPDRAGSTLTFKALQTYSNGELVRWIGSPDADEPAPQVMLTAAAAGAGDGAGAGHDGGAPAPDDSAAGAASGAPAASTTSAADDGASKGLGIAALVAGVAALLLAGAALLVAARGRRGRARAAGEAASR